MRLIIHQAAIYLRVEGIQVSSQEAGPGVQLDFKSSVGLPGGLVETLPSHQLSTLHLAASRRPLQGTQVCPCQPLFLWSQEVPG